MLIRIVAINCLPVKPEGVADFFSIILLIYKFDDTFDLITGQRYAVQPPKD